MASLGRLEWLVLAQPDRAAQAIDARLPGAARAPGADGG